jgi:3-deoxy-manno-octulosonate cytidylyltransferase (CMP-KDO synthetase)
VRLAAIIPARYGAQRLPGKPLADLLGKPMVVHVCARAAAAMGAQNVAVATDDDRIARAVEHAGFRAILTDPSCRNGTERVAQAARDLPADGYLNVQGDEPLIAPQAISALAGLLRGGAEMATLARPLLPEEAASDGVVKVVLNAKGEALYFSRSLIPFPRKPGLEPLAHIGLYGFSAGFLQTFAKLPVTELEETEQLEQLRALWHGYKIQVGVVPYTSIAVDTPDDLARVRRELEHEARRTS